MGIESANPIPTVHPRPRPALQPSNYAWVVVALLFVVAVLNYLDRLMITAMLTPIHAEFKSISQGDIGLITSVFLWVYAIVSPLGGFVADRFGKRWVIVASLFCWSLATCISGFAHTFHELLFARALMGVSEACYMPAALAIIADFHRGRTRSLATGVHMAGIYTGAILGGVLGGFMADHYGWRSGFRFFGLFGLGFGLLLAFTLRDRRPGEMDSGEFDSGDLFPEKTGTGPRAQAPAPLSTPDAPGPASSNRPDKPPLPLVDVLRALAVSPGFLLLFGVNICVGIINWSLYGWLPAFLEERFSLTLTAAGRTASVYLQSASFVGVLAAGAIADAWSRFRPRARALVPAIGFCVAGPCLFAVGTSAALPIVIVALIFVGVGRGSFDANHMPALRELMDERYSATGFGILNMISTAVGGLMVYAGGMLQDARAYRPDGTLIPHANVKSLSLVFQGCGVSMLLAGLLLLAIRFPGKKKKMRNE